jgi:PPOX class probable F420-dependent enzyme
MATQKLDPNFHDLLRGRYVATLGTENADGTIHLTAVWYLFEDGCLFIATSSKTRKARNVVARPKASLMVDARKPGTERGATAAGRVELISGGVSQEINRRLHSRYLSAAAMSDPTSGQCLNHLMMSRYDSRRFRGLLGTWQCWTLKPSGGDWAEPRDTCSRWIEGGCSQFGC